MLRVSEDSTVQPPVTAWPRHFFATAATIAELTKTRKTVCQFFLILF